MSEWTTPSFFISLVAIGVSAFSWWKSYGLERARERDRKREAGKALLVARLEAVPRPPDNKQTDYSIRISNSGRADARNVRCTVDGLPIAEAPGIVDGQRVIRSIPPGGTFPIKIGGIGHMWHRAKEMNDDAQAIIELTWEDQSGEPGICRASIPSPR